MMTPLRSITYLLITCLVLVLLLMSEVNAQSSQYTTIRVLDAETKRGVPLVELKTVNDRIYYTDSNGVVAFYEPGLMNKQVFFHVKSHGYQFPKDGFGYRGTKIQTTPGKTITIQIIWNCSVIKTHQNPNV